MAIFPEPFPFVGAALLYTRRRGAHQVMVFQVTLKSRRATSVFLPLPVVESELDKVRIINMDAYLSFFTDLSRGAGQPEPQLMPVGGESASISLSAGTPDLPRPFLRHWPGYRSYAFLQLDVQPSVVRSHLVACSFPSRHPDALYFPTLHSVSGDKQPSVSFDCMLFAQTDAGSPPDSWWRQTRHSAGAFMTQARGIVDPDQPCCFGHLSGMQLNGDRMVPLP